jgi:hypothetical protein
MKLTTLMTLPAAVTGLTGGGANNLDGIPTVDLANGWILTVVVTDEIYFYQLADGTDAESSPDVIRPDDFALSTNEKVWKRRDIYTP